MVGPKGRVSIDYLLRSNKRNQLATLPSIQIEEAYISTPVMCSVGMFAQNGLLIPTSTKLYAILA